MGRDARDVGGLYISPPAVWKEPRGPRGLLRRNQLILWNNALQAINPTVGGTILE